MGIYLSVSVLNFHSNVMRQMPFMILNLQKWKHSHEERYQLA